MERLSIFQGENAPLFRLVNWKKHQSFVDPPFNSLLPCALVVELFIGGGSESCLSTKVKEFRKK